MKASSHTPLRGEDGSPLELHEGVVLGADGAELTRDANSQKKSGAPRVFVFKGGPLVAGAAMLVIPVLLFFGFALAAIVLSLSLLFSLIRVGGARRA